jgi:hypothetical protein
MNATIAESALRILRSIRLPRRCRLRIALAQQLRAARNTIRSTKCTT